MNRENMPNLILLYFYTTALCSAFSEVLKVHKCVVMQMDGARADHEFLSTVSVTSFTGCFRQCVLTEDCETMNYIRNTGACDLLTALPESCYAPAQANGSVLYQMGDCVGNHILVSTFFLSFITGDPPLNHRLRLSPHRIKPEVSMPIPFLYSIITRASVY